MDIEKEIIELIKSKPGNKELALFFDPESDDWTLELGNNSDVVMLGETSGEITVNGPDIATVIAKAKDKLSA
jgi:hypothetical protein